MEKLYKIPMKHTLNRREMLRNDTSTFAETFFQLRNIDPMRHFFPS